MTFVRDLQLPARPHRSACPATHRLGVHPTTKPRRGPSSTRLRVRTAVARSVRAVAPRSSVSTGSLPALSRQLDPGFLVVGSFATRNLVRACNLSLFRIHILLATCIPCLLCFACFPFHRCVRLRVSLAHHGPPEQPQQRPHDTEENGDQEIPDCNAKPRYNGAQTLLKTQCG